MKRFSRCVLVLIIVAALSGSCGYIYENKKIIPMYTSTTQLYVVPGEENEASIRAKNGGLNNDFTIIFKSNVVISEAKKQIGTSEDIAQYLTVSSPDNSNIVEITCTNPDQNTAKQYVDAVAVTALKTTNIIPVKSIQILSVGTSTHQSIKPDLYKNTLMIAGIATAACMLLEIVLCLILAAFRKPKDDSDNELDYERNYGKYSTYQRPAMTGYIEAKNIDLGPDGAQIQVNNSDKSKEESLPFKKASNKKAERKKSAKIKDDLDDFDFSKSYFNNDVKDDPLVDDSSDELVPNVNNRSISTDGIPNNTATSNVDGLKVSNLTLGQMKSSKYMNTSDAKSDSSVELSETNFDEELEEDIVDHNDELADVSNQTLQHDLNDDFDTDFDDEFEDDSEDDLGDILEDELDDDDYDTEEQKVGSVQKDTDQSASDNSNDSIKDNVIRTAPFYDPMNDVAVAEVDTEEEKNTEDANRNKVEESKVDETKVGTSMVETSKAKESSSRILARIRK